MENKKECKIYNLEGILFVIPENQVEDFESTSYYDREKRFRNNILEDGSVIEEVFIDEYDLQCLIDGDL